MHLSLSKRSRRETLVEVLVRRGAACAILQAMLKREIQRGVREVLQRSPVRSRVRRVALFGSQLHGDARRDSDIDLLIEFTAPVSLLDLAGMELDLKERFCRNVDLRTPKSLSKYFRNEVLAEAEELYKNICDLSRMPFSKV